MGNRWVILDKIGGWLKNIIVWDGIQNWTPPENSDVKKESDVDYSQLPESPDSFQLKDIINYIFGGNKNGQ